MEIKQEYTQTKKQILSLTDRSRLSVGLVKNVECFSENEVLLDTQTGGLRISGSNLKLEDLSIQNGEVEITGRVDSMIFEEIKEKHSFLKGLFK